MEASLEMMHTFFAHSQDKKWMLLELITIRSIFSTLLIRAERSSHNEVMQSVCSVDPGFPFRLTYRRTLSIWLLPVNPTLLITNIKLEKE